jgi:hypothetical protein
LLFSGTILKIPVGEATGQDRNAHDLERPPRADLIVIYRESMPAEVCKTVLATENSFSPVT